MSIHADAFPDPRPNGVSVYALSKEGSESEMDQFMSNDEIRRDLNQGSTVIEIDKLEEGVDLILVDLIEDQTLAFSLEAGAAVVKRLSRVANKMHKKKVERASFLVLKSLDTPSLLIELVTSSACFGGITSLPSHSIQFPLEILIRDLIFKIASNAVAPTRTITLGFTSFIC